ncbi:hypothetical protein MMC17_004999 [Xylographa soralifera]|nr:hypothetical protein [Xylographa soralifera]
MSGRLACPSPHLLHQCRYLNLNKRSSPLIVCASLAFFNDTRLPRYSFAYSASVAQRPKDEVTTAIGDIGVSIEDACAVGPGRRKPDDKNIFVENLQATLEAHRAANQAKLIHKVKVDPGMGLGFRKLKLSHDQKSSSDRAQSQITAGETFLNLTKLGKTISKSKSLIYDLTEEERNIHDPSGSPSENQSATNQSLEYKGRYRVVQGQWQPRQGSPLRSSRRRLFKDNEDVGSQPRLVFSKVTDLVEEHNDGRPWIGYIKSEESDGMLRLNEEIRAFERFMKPTSDEEKSTQAAISRAQSVVATVAPTSVLTLHGSRYTGIADPLSDIDFSVSLPEYEKDSLKRGPSIHRPVAQRGGTTLLRKIEKALVKSPRYELVNFILARVNIVAAVDANTQLHLQFQTLASFMPAREYSMCYLSEFPALRPLYVLLRHFLLMRGFTGARDGGVGSYPLLIMIVTAFKHSRQTFAPENLGVQLLHILKFWSTADLHTYGYAADPPICFTKVPPKTSLEERNKRLANPILKGIDIIRKPKEDLPFLLCLQDPGNPTNDLGKRINQIKNIQACFATARENLIHSLRRWETLVEYNALQKRRQYSFLDSFVGGDYSTFHWQRQQVANAHKLKDKIVFNGQKRLDLEAHKSLPADKTETGPDGRADSIVSSSDGPDTSESLSSGTSIDSQ